MKTMCPPGYQHNGFVATHENNVPSWLSPQWLCGNYIHIYMIFNVVLRFLDLRYKVSLTRDSKPQPSDFHSNALLTELASLTQR